MAILSGILSALFTSLLASWVSHRRLAAEIRFKHRDILITKQLEACEHLWSLLGPVSTGAGNGRIVEPRQGEIFLRKAEAEAFCETLTREFYAPRGLYYSRNLRKRLFGLRDYLIGHLDHGSKEPFSLAEAKRLKEKVTLLRQAIRAEVGLENLELSGKALGGLD